MIKSILLLLTFNTFAQSELNKNNVFVGTLGHTGGLFNISYERVIYKNEKIHYLAGTGIGYTPALSEGLPYLPSKTSIPIFSKLLYGKNHYIMTGIGTSIILSDNVNDVNNSNVLIHKKIESNYSISLGYRYFDGYGFVGEAYPIFSIENNPRENTTISFGISIGWNW